MRRRTRERLRGDAGQRIWQRKVLDAVYSVVISLTYQLNGSQASVLSGAVVFVGASDGGSD